MNEPCVFCEIVAGRLPGRFVFDDDSACAFLDIRPWRLGHTIVVPRRHVPDLGADDAAVAVAELGPALRETTRTLMSRLGAEGVSVVQANGEAAGQEVSHVHFHLVPRWPGDQRLSDHTMDEAARDRLDETHRLLLGPESD